MAVAGLGLSLAGGAVVANLDEVLTPPPAQAPAPRPAPASPSAEGNPAVKSRTPGGPGPATALVFPGPVEHIERVTIQLEKQNGSGGYDIKQRVIAELIDSGLIRVTSEKGDQQSELTTRAALIAIRGGPKSKGFGITLDDQHGEGVNDTGLPSAAPERSPRIENVDMSGVRGPAPEDLLRAAGRTKVEGQGTASGGLAQLPGPFIPVDEDPLAQRNQDRRMEEMERKLDQILKRLGDSPAEVPR